MRNTSALLFLLCCALPVSAQDPAPEQPISRIAHSAQEQLAASVKALDDLRAQIGAEKLPLAQDLPAQEEHLTQLRRDFDQVSRAQDAGNLDIASIKAATKARQDELAYVGNLLDEYARTYESKVNVAELQNFGPQIETAKQATENTTLSMSEKFARQVGFAKASLQRLDDAIGGMRFDGVGVDLQGAVAQGQYALVGPVAIFRAAAGVAGMVLPQPGSINPLIRPLEGAMQDGLVALVQSGDGLLPLDPSRGGALKALIQRTNLVHIFQKGGPIMWPLLVASILSLATVLERLLFLAREKMRRDPKALDAFFAAVGRGDIEEAIRISHATKYFVVRALGYALEHKESSLVSALLYSQAQELKRFRRGIPILDTVITLAPLLGLLGTVTGMMGSFSLIGGDLGSPGAITGGIAEALIATAFGLGIAITSLLPFNFLNARLEDARHELESASTQLELLVPTQPVIVERVQSVSSQDETERTATIPQLDEAQRKLREVHRRRIALQRQIAELQTELADAELDSAMLVPQRKTMRD
jgi:biopolymer transport protein ExbB